MHGEKINAIWLARGYTQAYVARKIGIEQAAYSKIETNRKVKISDDLLTKIAMALGVSVDDIVSPSLIVMSFQNANQISRPDTTGDQAIIEALKEQLTKKDEQIAQLLAKIK